MSWSEKNTPNGHKFYFPCSDLHAERCEVPRTFEQHHRGAARSQASVRAHLPDLQGRDSNDYARGPHLTLGDCGTDGRYLDSGDEAGLASIDLGTSTEVTAGFGTSCRSSGRGALSSGTAAGVVMVFAPLCAVLGSRPDMVTVVSTPPPAGAGQEGPSRVEGSGWPSPAGLGKPCPSMCARAALSGSGSGALSGRVSGIASSAELRTGSETAPSYLGLGSSFLAAANTFCFFGAGSSSDDGT